jgi:hypothetical protein
MERPMRRRSISIREKLDRSLREDTVVGEIDTMMKVLNSRGRFDDRSELARYLSEGALLNINTIASKALSIPCGEYIVWVTDVGHTMLVPTKTQSSEVHESADDRYEIMTPKLLQNWNKIERVIGEAKDDDDDDGAIKLRVDPADIDRPTILRAMEDRGFTVTSLANAAGVEPPAISRLLRIPKDRQGDPGGRNPSMGLAATISKLLRVDPTALFPDIFGPSGMQDLGARKTPGNRGSGTSSGSTKKGKATKKWTQGSKNKKSKKSKKSN